MSTIYSTLKFLRYTEHLQALREKRVLAPIHVRIKPTNRCNHHCWYCAYKADQLQLGEDMREADEIPKDRMFALIAELIDLGVQAVTFSGGGEPLLYKPLAECVEQLHGGGIRVAALTNGSALSGPVAAAFAQYGTWLRISTDAWDDVSFQQMRGLRDAKAFSRVLDNMRRFVDTGTRCVLGISFIVTAQNSSHIAQACTLFKDAGAHHVKISGAVVANDLAENNLYHRTLAPMATEQIRLAQKTLADHRFAIVDHYHALEERFDKKYTFCPYLQFLTVIGADLGVYTCQDKAYTQLGRLGSLVDCSFREFWFSEENQQRLYGFDPSQKCRHHCVTNAKNLAILDYLALDQEHACFV